MMDYLAIKNDLYRMIGTKTGTTRGDLIAAVASAIRRAQEVFVNYGNWAFLEQQTDTVYIPLAPPYTTGTITVTQDSKTVTGSGTTFTKDMEGSFIQLTNQGWYEIRTFTSSTVIVLAVPYQGTSAAAQTFVIIKRFYPLPLNFIRPVALDAKLFNPGTTSESALVYHADASFNDVISQGAPLWFGIVGNMRRQDYFNVGTVNVSTTANVSSWTISSGTLPTDIVDREIRIRGETNSYYIDARTASTSCTTYDPYVNPADAGSSVANAVYAITPKETKLVGFSPCANDRYVAAIPYIKGIPDMIADSDVSPIVLAGYEDAFLATCRYLIALDGRTALRGDMVANLTRAYQEAIGGAWLNEQVAENMKQQDTGRRPDRTQMGPSWISR
jgi:hypothetical protein